MKKLFSVLTDDLEHCIITGDFNIQIHHVFNGPNHDLSEKYGFLVSAAFGLAQLHAVQYPHGSEI